MTPRVTLRKALEDPELLGSALAGPTWHAWRSLLLAAMGEPLEPGDELHDGASPASSRAMARSPYLPRSGLERTGVAALAPDRSKPRSARLCRGHSRSHTELILSRTAETLTSRPASRLR